MNTVQRGASAAALSITAAATLMGVQPVRADPPPPGSLCQSAIDAFIKLPDAFIKLPDAFIKIPDAFIKLPDAFIKIPDAFIKYAPELASLLEACLPAGGDESEGGDNNQPGGGGDSQS